MSYCHAEAHDHGHGHGHDHGEHDHSDDITPALQSLLYEQVEFDKVEIFGEKVRESGKKMMKKTWAERLQPDPMLASDPDPEVIIGVPFAGQVSLHSILIRTSDSESAPKTLHVFSNRTNLDFENINDFEPNQIFHLSRTNEVQEIAVKRSIFGSTQRLTLFFKDNFGNPLSSEIHYLAFKGDFMRLQRKGIAFTYEAAAQPGDHPAIPGTGQASGSILDNGAGGREGM